MDRSTYTLTEETVTTLRRALASRRTDVRADPDFADDERAERLDALDGALEALEAPALAATEWRIVLTADRRLEVHNEYDDEEEARSELALYRDEYPHHPVRLERREVGAWEPVA